MDWGPKKYPVDSIHLTERLMRELTANHNDGLAFLRELRVTRDAISAAYQQILDIAPQGTNEE
jgi:hypothetical protein